MAQYIIIIFTILFIGAILKIIICRKVIDESPECLQARLDIKQKMIKGEHIYFGNKKGKDNGIQT